MTKTPIPPPADWSERLLLLRALILLPIAYLFLRLFEYKSTVALFGGLARGLHRVFRRPGRHLATRVTDIVVLANRRWMPMQVKCLPESIVLWYLLRRRGVPAEIRLGVRNLSGFQAHAWVELWGAALNDPQRVSQVYETLEPAGERAS